MEHSINSLDMLHVSKYVKVCMNIGVRRVYVYNKTYVFIWTVYIVIVELSLGPETHLYIL